jgi:hypothetical protein
VRQVLHTEKMIDSFTTNELYNFIKYLSERYTIQIYIHTWSIKQNNISWRQINNDFTEINVEYIKSYFKDLFQFVKNGGKHTLYLL